MKTKTRLHTTTLCVPALLLFLAGCASSPKPTDPMQTLVAPPEKWRFKSADIVLKDGDVKGKPPETFAKPIDEVREAALRALTFVGCQLKHREDFYVMGRRPNKMGFFVGSGGETVEVFLYPKETNSTQVWVDTDLSFVGIAGQQGWDKQVKEEMRKLLNPSPVTP